MTLLDVHIMTEGDLQPLLFIPVILAVTVIGIWGMGSRKRRRIRTISFLIFIVLSYCGTLFQFDSPSNHSTWLLEWHPTFDSLSTGIKEHYGYDLVKIDQMEYVDSDFSADTTHDVVLRNGDQTLVTTLLVKSNPTNKGQDIQVFDNERKELPLVH